MKKTKLLTSLAALALVLGLGACETTSEETSSEDTSAVETTTETETTTEETSGGETTSESTSEGDTSESTSDDDTTPEEGTTYKLGAANPSTGVYYYFDGTALTTQYGSYLNVTTSWDDAAAVTITDLTDGGQSLSFVDGEGATKYISWSSSTAVDMADEAYTWYWLDSIEGYCTTTDTNGRFLALYANTLSFRAYTQTDEYLAYGHVAAYTEEPDPIEVETEPKTEPVVGTLTEGDYLLGIKIGEVDYYFDGTVYSDYYGNANSDISKAVAVTVATYGEGYSLSFTDGDGTTQYIYMSESSGHHNFSWGADKAFAWSYDTTYDTLVVLDSEGDYYFIGCFGTYVEFTMNDYGYLTGDKDTSNAQYPATLYEIPEGWGEEGQGEDEKQGGDDNEDETLVGTLDFSVWCTANANANTAFSTTTLGNCLTASYTGEGTITAGDTSTAYPASNGSGEGLKGSKECIQLGSSKAIGSISFSLSGTDEITRIVVKAVCYENSAKNMTVNNNSKSVSYICTSYSAWDDVPTIEYTIDAATTITIASTDTSARILLHSIELYSV